MNSRRCCGCGRTLPLTGEHWHRNAKRSDGFAAACRDCANARRVELNAAQGVSSRGMNSQHQLAMEVMYDNLHKLLQQRRRQPATPHALLTLRRTR